jgi:hypothetical protein
MAMLTRDEARRLVLTRLGAPDDPGYGVVDDRTIERPFGWLFLVTAAGPDGAPSEAPRPRPILVNKHAGQVVGSSIDYTPDRFVEIYERLLANNRTGARDWCMTLSLPWPWRGFRRRRRAQTATELGLYEIR